MVEHFANQILNLNSITTKQAQLNKSEPVALLEIQRKLNAAFPTLNSRELKQAVQERVRLGNFSLPEYHWPIRPMIVNTLRRQRDSANSYLGYEFFKDEDYHPVYQNDEADELVDQFAAELFNLI